MRARLAGLTAVAVGLAGAARASRRRRRALEAAAESRSGGEDAISAAELKRRLDETRDRLRREIPPEDLETPNR
jgi:hypothetical protein